MSRSKFVAASIPAVWRNCTPFLAGEELHREDHHHDLAPVRVRAPSAVGVRRPRAHALLEHACMDYDANSDAHVGGAEHVWVREPAHGEGGAK
jgi:hypothetical protein